VARGRRFSARASRVRARLPSLLNPSVHFPTMAILGETELPGVATHEARGRCVNPVRNARMVRAASNTVR
jgi:hypothetical protein